MSRTMLKQQTGYNYGTMLKKDFFRHRYIYLMLLPVVIYYVIFAYFPMYGVLMAFKDFSPMQGIFRSPFTASYGLQNFIDFFTGPYFVRVVSNTLSLNFLLLLCGFPAPIIFALLINEMKGKSYKRIVQTISYLPFFISMVVVAGIIRDFCNPNGLLNYIAQQVGYNNNVNLLNQAQFYRPIFVLSDIWQNIGFNSIIYICALSGINPELYESAVIDGAGRWKRLIYITLPGISSTIVILLILSLGSIMSVGLEKPLLLYNPAVYDVSDVITTYVYRQGLQSAQYGYSAAVGLFNSIINFIILLIANRLSRKVSETSLF
jgi:putative aldouronate transport system permease protein